VPRAPWLDVALDIAPDNSGPETNHMCARCHQVLFSRYPYTWEGGRRDATAGGSHINSGEGRDFLLGGCAGALSCTRCHDPHGGGDAGSVRALATPAGNAICTACHTDLAAPGRVRAHAHHDPSGAAGACVACHMPRKNMGLDGKLTRYHRIGSPTDAARVLGDRPLECALCHTDRRAGDLVAIMEKWWPVRYPRQRIEELYGSLDANVIRATLERGKPHEQAVAIGVLSEARALDAAPLLSRQLANEYPLVREWARRALDALDLPAQAPPAAAPPSAGDEDPED
jgi:predicted CXXCH cytochrome family protein